MSVVVKVVGALDNFECVDGRYFVGGWAYCEHDDGSRQQVPGFEIEGALYCVTRNARGDFSDGNAFGFRLEFSRIDQVLALVLGSLRCEAHSGGLRTELRVWNRLQAKVLGHAIDSVSLMLGREGMADLASVVASSIPRGASPDLPTVACNVTIGARSLDDSAILGRDGQVFLFGGSNLVQKLYERPLNVKAADRWEKLVQDRKAFCAESGAVFRQLIFPEKQTVLTDLYPLEIPVGTPLGNAVRSRLLSEQCFIDIQEQLRRMYIEGMNPYRRIDSHLSFHGAMESALRVALEFKRDFVLPRPILVRTPMTGDLGDKFTTGSLIEDVLVPEANAWSFARISPQLVKEITPTSGHTGTYREWANPDGAIDKTILVFGNSFCERGESVFGLSWWFSRIFKRTVFVWSREVSHDLIGSLKPDIVVAQTVERFLESVPSS